MSKHKKLLNALTSEKKVTNWKMHKRKKAFVAFAGVLAIGLGSAGLVYANAQSSSVKGNLPTDTTVNWEDNKPTCYVVDQTGKENPKPILKLGNGTMAWCLGLGVPLPNHSTQAQLDATNAILNALTDEQIAVLNNVDYLAQKDGSVLAYAQAQYATYLLLDEAGVSENQAKDVVVKDNTLLHDANAIKTGANDLITQAKKMRELPSFNGSTVDLIQGVEKKVTDSKGVMSNFPNFKSNVDGVKATVSGNDVKLKADISSKVGLFSKALQFWNTGSATASLPYYVYSTDGDSTGKSSQSVIASQDPSQAMGSLNVNIIGLGEATLTKVDADTGSGETQGAAHLKGAVFGLFNKSDNSPVKWSDGKKGYPITVTAGTKADDTNVS
ncbi:cell surface protein precursor, partial [Lactococcus lactis subsp. lactis]|nr:cell surface protein precursor [Lactococcus lactis subsp. lactis]